MRGLFSVLLGFLLVTGLVYGKDDTKGKEKTAKSLIETSGERSAQRIKERELSKIVHKAVEVYAKGNRAVLLLTHNDIKGAKKLLEDLLKDLKQLQEEYRGKIDRLPIDVVITEISGITDLKRAEELAKKAKKAVEENDFITARFILDSLRDEIQIETAYLPLELFRDAVELANKLLNEGKIKDAIAQLQVALGFVEIETTIIPKPLAVASILVEDAEKVFKKDPKKALELLKEAKRQLKLAELLGYVKTEKDVKPLISQIEKLERSITEKTGSKEKFRSLFESIEKIKEKSTQTK